MIKRDPPVAYSLTTPASADKHRSMILDSSRTIMFKHNVERVGTRASSVISSISTIGFILKTYFYN